MFGSFCTSARAFSAAVAKSLASKAVRTAFNAALLDMVPVRAQPGLGERGGLGVVEKDAVDRLASIRHGLIGIPQLWSTVGYNQTSLLSNPSLSEVIFVNLPRLSCRNSICILLKLFIATSRGVYDCLSAAFRERINCSWLPQLQRSSSAQIY